MPGVAVVGKDVAGGAQAGGGQDWVTIDGDKVSVLGDMVMPHGLPPHTAPSMVTGVSWVTIDGIPVCRAGDMASCGHSTSGRSWVTIDG